MKVKITFRMVVSGIACILFILPLFWFPKDMMDLGGDSNRLYFWRPLEFLRYTSMYYAVTIGKGYVEPHFYYIPYVLFLAFIRNFVSSTIAIGLINGL